MSKTEDWSLVNENIRIAAKKYPNNTGKDIYPICADSCVKEAPVLHGVDFECDMLH